MYLFGAYTPASTIDRSLGFKWQGDTQMEAGGEGETLIVFVKNGQVVCSVNFARNDGDFASIDVPNGLTPTEAQFVPGPNRTMRLLGSATTLPATHP